MVLPFKMDVLEKALQGKISSALFLYNPKNYTLDADGITVPELYEKASYVLNRDFKVTAGWKNKLMNEGSNHEVEGYSVHVEKIYTLENGLCYSITFEAINSKTVLGFRGYYPIIGI